MATDEDPNELLRAGALESQRTEADDQANEDPEMGRVEDSGLAEEVDEGSQLAPEREVAPSVSRADTAKPPEIVDLEAKPVREAPFDEPSHPAAGAPQADERRPVASFKGDAADPQGPPEDESKLDEVRFLLGEPVSLEPLEDLPLDEADRTQWHREFERLAAERGISLAPGASELESDAPPIESLLDLSFNAPQTRSKEIDQPSVSRDEVEMRRGEFEQLRRKLADGSVGDAPAHEEASEETSPGDPAADSEQAWEADL